MRRKRSVALCHFMAQSLGRNGENKGVSVQPQQQHIPPPRMANGKLQNSHRPRQARLRGLLCGVHKYTPQKGAAHRSDHVEVVHRRELIPAECVSLQRPRAWGRTGGGPAAWTTQRSGGRRWCRCRASPKTSSNTRRTASSDTRRP